MSVIPASQAREITDNSHKYNVELWYAKFKDILFNEIQIAALNGNHKTIITQNHWNNDENKINYLKEQLLKLGYKFEKYNNETLSDIYFCFMVAALIIKVAYFFI